MCGNAEGKGVHRVRRTSKDVSPEGETSRSSMVRGGNLRCREEAFSLTSECVRSLLVLEFELRYGRDMGVREI